MFALLIEPWGAPLLFAAFSLVVVGIGAALGQGLALLPIVASAYVVALATLVIVRRQQRDAMAHLRHRLHSGELYDQWARRKG
ncbi:MAG: hypothetical protein JWO68_3777 [Actinomycetia bacterium]|nr:hypothetical protein [Actinomycetes bacterium]